MQVRQYGLPQRRHQGHRAIASLLVRADRERPHLPRTAGSQFFCGTDTISPGLPDKTGSCSRQKQSCSRPLASSCEENPESRDQHPGFHSPQEAKGVFCPLRTGNKIPSYQDPWKLTPCGREKERGSREIREETGIKSPENVTRAKHTFHSYHFSRLIIF